MQLFLFIGIDGRSINSFHEYQVLQMRLPIKMRLLLAILRLGSPPIHKMDITTGQKKSNSKLAARILDFHRVRLPQVKTEVIPVRDGRLNARWYIPPSPTSMLMVYFHGGGFVLGGLEGHDHFCRRLAKVTHTPLVCH